DAVGLLRRATQTGLLRGGRSGLRAGRRSLRRRCLRGRSRSRLLLRGRLLGRLGLRGCQHVLLADPATDAAALDGGQVDAVLGGQLAHQRRDVRPLLVAVGRRLGGLRRGLRGRLLWLSGSLLCGSLLLSGSGLLGRWLLRGCLLRGGFLSGGFLLGRRLLCGSLLLSGSGLLRSRLCRTALTRGPDDGQLAA